MLGCLKSLIGKGTVLVLMLAAAYAGWRWGPQVFPRIQEWMDQRGGGEASGVVSSPELADSVLARVQGFRRGEGPAQLAFGDRELTSVLRYAVPELMPAGVMSPEVRLQEGRIHLRARVALAAFPDLPDLGPILGILPDTLDVEVEASLMPFGMGKAALLVHRVEASRIPLPRRLVPQILTAMGRRDQPGLPPEALLVTLPSGLSSAYILTDSLFLSSDP
jgi:hypothetical protein